MSDPSGVIAMSPGIDMPWKLLVYLTNRFLPDTYISEAGTGSPIPLPTVATTFPASIFTDTLNVAGPIADVTGAVHSPMNGAACAGVTVGGIDCGTRQAAAGLSNTPMVATISTSESQ